MDQRAPSSHLDIASKPARRRTRRAKRWSVKKIPGGRRSIWLALAIVILGGVLLIIRPGAGHKPGPPPPTPVGVAKATSGDLAIRLNALGTATPLATVTVRSQVSGQLAAINFTEGQSVNAGDLLAQIDPRPFQAALDQAKGQLARDQAQLANARVDLGRYKTLLAQQSISEQQNATQAALVLQDEGIVKSDQAAVETAAINLEFTHITSPVTGRVGLRQVDLGNLVMAQSTNIVVVTQLQPISAIFALPEDTIAQITQRLNQGATLEATAFDRTGTQTIATGKLATLDNEIDVTTGTVKLRAMFDNADNALFPNQFVNIQLLVDTQHNQTIIPTAAVQRGANGAFVFVVNPDNTVKMTTVTLGATDGEHQSVTDGVKAGDTVVIDGADRLKDGAHVQIPNSNDPGTNGATAQKPGENQAPNKNGNSGKAKNGGARRSPSDN